MENEFSPADVFVRSIRLWWVVVFFALIGGGIAFIVHGILPPVFSSRMSITTSINFAQTGNLTDEKQDQAINAAGNVILSSAVEDALLSQAAVEGIGIDRNTFESARFTDRMGYEWIIGVESKDPNTAAALTNVWGENALTILNGYLIHAIKAEALSKTLDNLEACFEEVGVTAPSSATCQSMGIMDIQYSIDQTSTLLSMEITGSHAIIPSMSFALDSKAEVATSPAYRNRNLMVMSGLMIGFIAGVLITQISFKKK